MANTALYSFKTDGRTDRQTTSVIGGKNKSARGRSYEITKIYANYCETTGFSFLDFLIYQI